MYTCKHINNQAKTSHIHTPGAFESVYFLTWSQGENSEGKKIVYKPSSVDGHYFVQGNHKSSFASILNKQLRVDYRLPLFDVVRLKDEDGKHFGFIQFVHGYSKETGCVNFGEDKTLYERYSKKCGVIAAIALAVCLDDLHFENVMATKKGPYIIDAETAFRPDAHFILPQTQLFDVGDGAFMCSKPAEGRSHNSGFIYMNKLQRLDGAAFIDGFHKAYSAIISTKDLFNFDKRLKDVCTRVLLYSTSTLKGFLKGKSNKDGAMQLDVKEIAQADFKFSPGQKLK